MTATIDLSTPHAAAKWVAARFGPVHPLDHPELVRCVGAHRPDSPCDGKRGKHPCTAWGSAATTDPQTLSNWFLRMKRNIGLACGPSGLLVVDEDELGAFAAYAARIGQTIPPTFTVRTARGRHFYFRQDGRFGNSDGALHDLKIDVRGKGGMVVAPGSVHESGHVYEPDDPDADVADLPDWLAQTLSDRLGKKAKTPTAPATNPDGSINWDAFAQPVNLHTGSYEDRHNELVSYSGDLLSRGVRLHEAEILIAKRWEDAPQPAGDIYPLETALGDVRDVYERYAAPTQATNADLSPYERAVAEEAAKLRVREEAARVVRQERASALPEPSLVRLDQFLAVEDEPVQYRVEELWPVGGRIVCAAQYKAGKTTLRNNLARALADQTPFLGHFPVNAPAGKVVIVDNELDERMVRRWLRDQGINKTDRIEVCCIRGNVTSFDLLDPDTRSRWAAKLRAVEAGVLLFDCLRPVLDALGLSEDKDAGRFLVAFDALLAEAGISEGVVVHHMGHSGERSRGDTRIRDWPDAEWRLLREKDDSGQQDGDSRRVYFSAFGRDVDSPEGLLEYDENTRHLTMTGGNRRETASEALLPVLLDFLGQNPDASGRTVETTLGKLGHKRADVRGAVARGLSRQLIGTKTGPRNATLHFVIEPECASSPSSPEVRQRSQSECASAPIGGALHSLDTEGSSPPGELDTQDLPYGYEAEDVAS